MHGRSLFALFAVLFIVACGPAIKAPTPVPPQSPEVTLDALTEGQSAHGFTAQALYLDAADQPIGARFIHASTGFVFDYLRIESAPQAFVWATSFPTSDKGEPHTQEHLLLGKGDRGRKLGSSEAMALAESSAFTAQWRTAYHFHTVAGQDTFWPVFEGQLDALINPDYTDEEIRREVRNFGVDKADDGTLRLEEKGTVYNEMVRTYEAPDTVMWRAANQLVYGAKHPLALDSGGNPEAIRTMTAGDIRAFHDSAYHLANMGMVGAFPAAMKLGDVLDHTAAILTKEAGRKGRVMTEADLPKPAPAPPGTIALVDYPYENTTNPGPIMLMWPATRALTGADRTLLALFLDTFAGDEGTPLYKKLIDGKTRVMDLGASAVWSMTSTDQGEPVAIGLNGVKADKLDEKTVGEVRTLVTTELARLAKLPDGDPELVAFDQRMQSRVVDARRHYAKLLDTPPGFGFRGTSSTWMDHLEELSRGKGFRRSLTLRPALAQVERILAAPGNPWRDRLVAWGLTAEPYGIAARPSPAERAKLDAEHKQRIDAELARLAKLYGTTAPAATLARFQQDEAAETKRLEESAKAAPLPALVASPPMTLDDGLSYTTGKIAAATTFTATFDAMASARVELSFRLNRALAREDQVYLAALPALLGEAGVIVDGRPIASDEMKDRLRKEILDLSVHYSGNPRTGRVELVVAGAGNGADETKAALGWMRRVMTAPDWRIENLPRLRDLVDQQLDEARQRMLGPEESWVDNPRNAWWQQSSLAAHTDSFLTQAHDLHRLRWMLADPQDSKVTDEVVKFLTTLETSKKLPRGELAKLAKLAPKVSPKAMPLAQQAAKDLAALLSDLPDDSLAADWSYLCRQMAHDLKVGAPATLAKLASVRAQLLLQGERVRLVLVGSKANQAAVAADVDALVRGLPVPPNASSLADQPEHPFRDRLREREPGATQAKFVGLFAPSTSSGVFVDLAPATAYTDATDDAVLDYLASNLYTGHGAHSMFMKTWAAGLAYSNGLHPKIALGMIDYYAERCPLLPQTLRFVIDELRKAKPDPNIARYAIATAFTSRLANDYEERSSALAADLEDGLSPAVIRAFRNKILAAAKRPDLTDVLFARMQPVYGKVLPGYGKLADDGVYFVIGPDKQLTAYQDYLHGAVAKDATLYRLYPRDFWLPAKL